MQFRSIGHVTRNERGLEQVEIELERSWWQRITGRPVELIFECWPTGWRDKTTGEYATLEQRSMIALAIHQVARCR